MLNGDCLCVQYNDDKLIQVVCMTVVYINKRELGQPLTSARNEEFRVNYSRYGWYEWYIELSIEDALNPQLTYNQ